MDKDLAVILAATARLEEQGKGLRRDVQELKQHTSGVLALHQVAITSLQRSRASLTGWAKGVSAVTVLGGTVFSLFKWVI